MANWKFEGERKRGDLYIWLLRDGIRIGSLDGEILGGTNSPRSFGAAHISVGNEFHGEYLAVGNKYQEEYMNAHNGMMMGEALGLKLLETLKKEGVSHIWGSGLLTVGKRLAEELIGSGIIIKESPELPLKLNWNRIPVSEEVTKKMIAKIRARESRAAKIKRALKWVGRTARKLRRTRPR